MPMLVSRGAASGKGFGLTNAAGGGGTLQTVTFNSSGNWVAPASVTLVTNLTGQGGSSTSDYVGGLSVCYVSVTNSASGSGANNLPISGSGLANDASTFVSLSSASSGYYLYNLYNGATLADDVAFTFYASNTFSFSKSYPYGTGNFPYVLVPGTWSVANTGTYPLSSNYGYGSTPSYYATGSAYFPGSSGGTTTALGYSFAGASQSGSYPNATGQSASSTTYNNITVTPGASYYINVASGGQVVIQYYA